MTFQHLKIQVPAFLASVSVDELLQASTPEDPQLINTIVQVIIGILSIIGFFRNRKNQS